MNFYHGFQAPDIILPESLSEKKAGIIYEDINSTFFFQYCSYCLFY